jgi:DNA-directed RNA polymerase specialized sigma24 family protein
MARREKEWNTDPEWVEFIEKLVPVIYRIAYKYTADAGLQDDCVQVARIALYQTHPQQIHAYKAWKEGQISDKAWEGHISRYCRNIARNRIISYLNSHTTGSWAVGRRGSPTRYSSFDLMIETGAQFDEQGTLYTPNARDTALFFTREDEEE